LSLVKQMLIKEDMSCALGKTTQGIELTFFQSLIWGIWVKASLGGTMKNHLKEWLKNKK